MIKGITSKGEGSNQKVTFVLLYKVIGPPQVKCRLLSSSIFDAMNFQHFLEKLEIMFQPKKKEQESAEAIRGLKKEYSSDNNGISFLNI